MGMVQRCGRIKNLLRQLRVNQSGRGGGGGVGAGRILKRGLPKNNNYSLKGGGEGQAKKILGVKGGVTK